ncbi:hypothetical protein F5Y14DRAFT_397283 [Nemania sp. NC0429]|nr:hypothetical protein F5Y14DRAFT_397283 [Nemania sp. NC0429]
MVFAFCTCGNFFPPFLFLFSLLFHIIIAMVLGNFITKKIFAKIKVEEKSSNSYLWFNLGTLILLNRLDIKA